jgi:hypothetical protein
MSDGTGAIRRTTWYDRPCPTCFSFAMVGDTGTEARDS